MKNISYRSNRTLAAAMVALLVVAVCAPRQAAARVRLKDICTRAIADLKIVRNKTGKVNDSARLPWGARLVDIIFPF